jgi:hypothetical protein
VAAGARAHDQADLRDDARGVNVAAEDLAIQAEGDDALLDARAAGVVDADDRATGLHRQVHDLDDLLAEDLTERAAEDREVLGEDAHGATVDGAVAGDDAVAVGPVAVLPEVAGAVPGQAVQLDEAVLVEELEDALARGLLSLGMLLFDGPLGAGVQQLVVAAAEIGQLAGGRVQVRRRRPGRGSIGHGRSLALCAWRWP